MLKIAIFTYDLYVWADFEKNERIFLNHTNYNKEFKQIFQVHKYPSFFYSMDPEKFFAIKNDIQSYTMRDIMLLFCYWPRRLDQAVLGITLSQGTITIIFLIFGSL